MQNEKEKSKKELRIAQIYYGSIVKMMTIVKKKMLETGNDKLQLE